MKNKYTNYKVSLFIGLLSLNTLAACVNTRQELDIEHGRTEQSVRSRRTEQSWTLGNLRRAYNTNPRRVLAYATGGLAFASMVVGLKAWEIVHSLSLFSTNLNSPSWIPVSTTSMFLTTESTGRTGRNLDEYASTLRSAIKKFSSTEARSSMPTTELLDAIFTSIARFDIKIPMLEAWINAGGDVNVKNFLGKTFLIAASRFDHAEAVQWLIHNKADVNAEDNEGETALISAALYDHVQTVQLLLNNKADVNTKDNYGRTALMSAARSARAIRSGSAKTVQLLLNNKADVNAEDKHGITALMYAKIFKHKEIVTLLTNNNADVNVQNESIKD